MTPRGHSFAKTKNLLQTNESTAQSHHQAYVTAAKPTRDSVKTGEFPTRLTIDRGPSLLGQQRPASAFPHSH
jgi:hypothetical protein